MIPTGIIASIQNVSGGGTGAGSGKPTTFGRNVTVALKGEEDAPGSCPSGATSNPTSVRLVLTDDDGDLILDQTKMNVVCTSGETTYEKFFAEFTAPQNCKGSVAPINLTKGDIFADVTTNPDSGSLNVTRKIQCKRGGNN